MWTGMTMSFVLAGNLNIDGCGMGRLTVYLEALLHRIDFNEKGV